ncbi:MAG: YkgJ family cysteine cluster protein [Chloroflexi bacterium]|nr:YkgJ family cysteine cluster protein [Chloroflexota bacterium]
MDEPALQRLVAAWQRVESRYRAYGLLLPGQPSFICQPQACDAHCCRSFSVSLGDHEVQRMQATAGLSPVEFLESEEGEPIALPLARPYLLARVENRCALLSPDLACGRYEGRPDACRLYPHQVLVVDETTGRPSATASGAPVAAVDQFLRGEPGGTLPLLLRHLECPGFTGPPLTAAAWAVLLRNTCELQYGGPPWP